MDSFEIVGFIAAFLTTSAFVPQVYKAYKTKEVKDISLTMYVAMAVGVFLWLLYGVHLNSPSIITANTVTLVLVLLMIFFKFRYKEK